jgi:hypothetical protein
MREMVAQAQNITCPCAVLVDDDLLRLRAAVHPDIQTTPDQNPGDVRRVAAAEHGHLAGTLDDRIAYLVQRIPSLDVGLLPMAQHDPVGHLILELRLLLPDAVLQTCSIGFDL